MCDGKCNGFDFSTCLSECIAKGEQICLYLSNEENEAVFSVCIERNGEHKICLFPMSIEVGGDKYVRLFKNERDMVFWIKVGNKPKDVDKIRAYLSKVAPYCDADKAFQNNQDRMKRVCPYYAEVFMSNCCREVNGE